MNGEVVLVTGGTRGVGLGIVHAFAKAGAQVVTCGRSEVDSEFRYVRADVRDPSQVDTLIETVVAEYGRLDVVVNNAGGAPPALAASASPRLHQKIVELNLLAPLHVSQRANTVMQQQDSGGAIVMIGSVSGTRPSPGTAAYGAAKAGLANLATSLAVEWAPKVRVNTVVVGPVDTELSQVHYGDEAGVAAVGETIPMGRMATPADVGEACLYLASPAAAYVTGSTLTVHGGGERPAFLSASNAEVPK
ncbi:NAD(P)-dependent dehydrogenase (short-subunit alcohol dehydrogenase family) [Actinophytocola oryzae]|uniref:NAD(P)-dependent dehydrogenase (Short-subunit alcohol dehydrogenase family) n=1 Tax=Actinophytocola oryzae TaxID=502181 RepID=A0A4R7VPH5_9PSEU|nr:SDR family oxidoreductase [Actinophytocola oryzae]TDV51117.1 NAD(P)-dependent dehydrogenase (short-subunit alcohol dehydrogenase family) [Actinophytocola oryzae]